MCGRCGCVRLGPRTGPDRPAQVEGLLEAALLLVLRDGRGYGYELASSVSSRGFVPQRAPAPRVYEALRRMERESAVTSAHEPSPGGPDRRLYRLTALGIQRLDRWAGALRSAQRGLSAFLSSYDSEGKEVKSMSCECECGETQQAAGALAAAQHRVEEPESLEARLERLEAELRELRLKS